MRSRTPEAAPGPTFRSGAVARLAGMPVATLRIWEQRYRAVRPATAPSGHRIYSPADLQRVLLLRQLTRQGHAIGSVATLNSAQLRRLALADGGRAGSADTLSGRPPPAMRLAVVGSALALRLQRPAVAARLARSPRVTAVFESLPEAVRAASGVRTDLLIWHAPELHRSGKTPDLQAAREACRARQVAVVYRFAGSTALKALADAGAVAMREPADDESLGTWLASIEADLSARQAGRSSLGAPDEGAGLPAGTVAPRRFDDDALTAIAGLSPTLACECPRHVAELLMQLSSFETYSAGCIDRSPADAELHAYLQQVAGASRALFESALERLARHEGLRLR